MRTKFVLVLVKLKFFFFKSLKKNEIDSDLQLKLNGKRVYPKDAVKYLAIVIHKSLTWHHRINNAAAKLNKANTMLSKIRYFKNFNTLKSIYHAIFESPVNYSLLVWAKNTNSIKDFCSFKRNP